VGVGTRPMETVRRQGGQSAVNVKRQDQRPDNVRQSYKKEWSRRSNVITKKPKRLRKKRKPGYRGSSRGGEGERTTTTDLEGHA